MKSALLAALTLGLLLSPLPVLPTAGADVGNRVTGDPSCATPSSSGSRFTGYYDNSQPELYFIMIGGLAWCDRTNTTTASGSGIVAYVFTPHGGVSAWWTKASNAGCQIGVNYNLPDRNRSYIVTCPVGAPDPGWGYLPLP